MAWNEPGGNGKDPWGNRGSGNQGPPDLDEVFKKFGDKLNSIFGGGKGGSGSGGESGRPTSPSNSSMFSIAIIVLVVWLAYDSAYIVQQAQRGVVLRFGEYATTIQPGLNIRFPRPIENVLIVNVDQVRTIEVGYRSTPGGRTTADQPGEALMLTQDENIIDIKFAVQYKVKDAKDYLFNDYNPDLTLRMATESAIREIIGKRKMDFVLTEGRGDVANTAQKLIQEIVDRYGTGLIVTNLNMQDAQPPEEVQDAFADAVKAREDEQRLKNEAETYSNDILPKARGAAARQLAEANAYKEQIIANSTGEADRFSQLLREYEKAPSVTRERLYIETMEYVLANSSKVMVSMKKGNNFFYMPLDSVMKNSGNSSGPDVASQLLPSIINQQPSGSKNTSDNLTRFRDSYRERSTR
ncbi:MAG: FtsH protease activity modulator HflK [Gammaproteobacteria bacterium]|nr:FtsH protease activity modulator HflK [Gammaproteobacteria bacterium]